MQDLGESVSVVPGGVSRTAQLPIQHGRRQSGGGVDGDGEPGNAEGIALPRRASVARHPLDVAVYCGGFRGCVVIAVRRVTYRL